MAIENKKRYKCDGVLIMEADRSNGDRFDIIAAVNESGHSPFYDEYFLPLVDKYSKSLKKNVSLNKKDQKNYQVLMNMFKKFCRTGSWKNKQQLGVLCDGYYEFKCVSTGLRVPFYYDNENRNIIVLTHYFEKKRQKAPKKELNRMKEIKKSFENYREVN